MTIDCENVEELLINSCNFLLPDIVKAACDWLERSLTYENVVDVLELAQFVQSDQESVEKLQETAFKFIVENFSGKFSVDFFSILSVSQSISQSTKLTVIQTINQSINCLIN